jgi:hypothetical protein
MNLTTEKIIASVIAYTEDEVTPPDWAWECAIESAVSQSGERDAADAARFLEHLEPCKEWTAEEYHGLMHHHFTGRWVSAAEIGAIRAHEKFQDLTEKLDPEDEQYKRCVARLAERTASDEAAEKFVRSIIGTYVFDCPDGTVLTFDGIFAGVIDTEDPV